MAAPVRVFETVRQKSGVQATPSSSSGYLNGTSDQSSPSSPACLERSTIPRWPTATQWPGEAQETSRRVGP